MALMRRTPLLAVVAAAAVLAVCGTAAAHIFDHTVPSGAPSAPLSSAFNSGGQDAQWELVGSVPTGNPHTDLDFFTRGGETYAAVGTLAAGGNRGGQSIVRLTDKGKVSPSYVSGHPSATCVSNPAAALGLQHDVEASPKGGTLLGYPNPYTAPGDAQVIVDATDAEGRCHDQGGLGVPRRAPRRPGDRRRHRPRAAKEIGLTSHIGEAHTVNIDPKRPHIAYAVTSDSVSLGRRRRPDLPPERGPPRRRPLRPRRLRGRRHVLVHELPAPARRSTRSAIAAGREVFRYRYENVQWALGHSIKDAIYGCHELEIHPDDRLTVRLGRGAAGVRHEGRLRRPRHARRLHRRQAARPAAAVPHARLEHRRAAPHRRDGHGLRRRRRPRRRRPRGAGLDRGRQAVARGRALPRLGPPPGPRRDRRGEPADDLGAGHRLRPRGRAVAVQGAAAGDGRARRRHRPARGVLRARRATSRSATAACTPTARARCGPTARARPRSPSRPTPRTPRAAGRSTAPRSAPSRRARSAPRTSSSRSRARTGSSWAGTRRARRSWTSPRTPTGPSTSRRPATSSRRTRTRGCRTSSRWSATATGPSTTTGRRATSTSARGGRNAIDVYKVRLPAPPIPKGGILPGTPELPVRATRRGATACKSSLGFAQRARQAARARAGVRRSRAAPATRSRSTSSAPPAAAASRVSGASRGSTASARRSAGTAAAGRVRNGYYIVRFAVRAPNGSTDFRRVALRRRGGRFRSLPGVLPRQAVHAGADVQARAAGVRRHQAAQARHRVPARARGARDA